MTDSKKPTNPPTELAKKRESGKMMRASLLDAIVFYLTRQDAEAATPDEAWVSAAKLRSDLGASLKDFTRVTYQMSLSATIEARGWGGAREYRLRHRITGTDRKRVLGREVP